MCVVDFLMKKDIDHYVLKGAPFSLIDYLRTSHPCRGSEGQDQRRVLDRIKQYPRLIGLDAAVKMFEGRQFVNVKGNTITCPDLIAYDGNLFSVIEAGYDGINDQLDTADTIFKLNFEISPLLIAARVIKGTQGGFTYSKRFQGSRASEYVQVEPEPQPWPTQEHPPRY